MMTARPLLLLFSSLLLCPVVGFSQAKTWYKSYTGTISKYPITLHLLKKSDHYSGYYYYNSRQEPIGLGGTQDLNTGSIKLSAFVPLKESSETFTITLAGDSLSGKWLADEKAQPLAFSAKEMKLPLAFDFIYTEGSVLLKPKIKDSPGAEFSASSVWPKGNSAQALFIKKIIREIFEEKNSSEDIGKIFLARKKEYFDEYLEQTKDEADGELSPSLNYSESTSTEIIFQNQKLLMLATDFSAYTGGAHGNYSTNYTPIDLVANKQLKLSDIVNSAGQKALPKLLEKSFRKVYSIQDNESLVEGGLFENKIEPSDNFYVTTKGIGFCYSPYEIGPYVLGQINLYIPFTELSTYLQPGFRKIIQ
jgi:hypothetical protein